MKLNPPAISVRNLYYCGGREISGLSNFTDPKKMMIDTCVAFAVNRGMFRQMHDTHGRVYLDVAVSRASLTKGSGGFSQVIFTVAEPIRGLTKEAKALLKLERPLTYGDKFAKFIEDNDLGTVTPTPRKVNPNSRNPGKMFMWTINHGKLDKFYRENVLKEEKQEGRGPLRLGR